MTGYFYVFEDEDTAVSAESWISQVGGAPLVGYNAKTGEPEPEKKKTERWAVPVQRQTDWKWVFSVVPDHLASKFDQATIDYFKSTFPHVREAFDSSWFPQEGE